LGHRETWTYLVLVSGWHRAARSFALLGAVLAALVTASAAAAQETPRLLKSGLFSPARWCGEHAVILVDHEPRTFASIDLDSRKQVTLSVPRNLRGRTSAMEHFHCSPDGRWIFGRFDLPLGPDVPVCDLPRRKLPLAVLWDTTDGRHHVIGRGYWVAEWTRDGSTLLYRLGTAGCPDLSRSWLRMPAGLPFRAVALYDLVREALGPNSGWTDDDYIFDELSFFTPALHWFGPNLLKIILAERRRLDSSKPKDDDQDDDSSSVTVTLLVQIRDGRGVRAEQLISPDDDLIDGAVPRLAIPKVFGREGDYIGAAAPCGAESRSAAVECLTPAIRKDTIQINIERFCRGLAAGDIEAFCAPVSARWERMQRNGRVLLSREHLAPMPGRDERQLDLFVIENDQRGYYWTGTDPVAQERKRQELERQRASANQALQRALERKAEETRRLLDPRGGAR
jgi:hypothetical protein